MQQCGALARAPTALLPRRAFAPAFGVRGAAAAAAAPSPRLSLASAAAAAAASATRRQQQQLHQQQQQFARSRSRSSSVVASATGGSDGGGSGDNDSGGGGALISGALLALWGGLLFYVFTLAPNQTPTLDAFIVQKLVGLKADDPYQVNAVFAAIFNAMGLYPLIYAALLIPAARSDRLPAWPFVTASVFLGAYALIPYMALWSPKRVPEQLPPPKEELEGWGRLYMKGAETAVLPALLAAGAGYYLFQAATAGGAAWADYLKLFDSSRLAHATSVDFALCTLLAPFWMANDAEGRKWEQRGALLPVLSVVPLLGPAVYLLLRPKADLSAK